MRTHLPVRLSEILPSISLLLIILLSPADTFASEAPAGEMTLAEMKPAQVKPVGRAQGRANRLVGASSPYLLQHAYNAVDWYPWGDEAFERARREDKPIFLSIGYASCHWCHGMARESFDNEKIAAFLNAHFISIKVDREQRPDIDAIYLMATRKVNGYAGWPMSVFIDHRRRPFHTGVYYPPFTVDGHTGFYTVITQIHDMWKNQRKKVDDVAKALSDYIIDASDEASRQASGDERQEHPSLEAGIYRKALQVIEQRYDPDYGGFSDAPKFYSPGIHRLLVASGQQAAREMSARTLDNILYGGIHDQLAGGFHRYAVDAEWTQPHFEKMLYSQALITGSLLDLIETEKLSALQEGRFRTAVRSTLDFVARDMRHPGGGFIAALSAESGSAEQVKLELDPEQPGATQEDRPVEGAYYLWQMQELESVLDEQELALVSEYYALDDSGNIDFDPKGRFVDMNILHVDEHYRVTLNEDAKTLTGKQPGLLSSARQKMLALRSKREPPSPDDKVITAWNAMMIISYARASAVLDEPACMDVAREAAGFIRRQHYDGKTGVIYRQRYSVSEAGGDGEQYASTVAGSVDATLSDYAWLIRALLIIDALQPDEDLRQWAVALQATQDRLFYDHASSSYFDFADEPGQGDMTENPLFRTRTASDGHLPSANAITLANLIRFARLLPGMSEQYLQRSRKLAGSFAQHINQDPVSAATMLAVIPPSLFASISK